MQGDAEQAIYAFRSEGRCIVVAQGDQDVSDEQFEAMVSELKRVVRTHGSIRILIHAAGEGTPNAKQRALLQELASSDLRMAIVTDSKTVGVVVRAISWILKRPMRVLPSREADQAHEFLGLSTPEQLTLRRLAAEVCAEGGYPRLTL